MSYSSVTVILENSRGEILLQLRDDKPTIPYPNQWVLPGGKMEAADASPLAALERELQEEFELRLQSPPRYWKPFPHPDRTEHLFTARQDLDLAQTPVHEGQRIAFFPPAEILKLNLGFQDNETVRNYLAR